MSTPFSPEELELAQLLKAYGLPWTPSVGQYVLDQAGLIECPSPFQDRVYFILEMKHFLRRSETVERLVDGMCWLPTWEQARKLLVELGIEQAYVARRLVESGAIERGDERLELYRILEASVTGELSSGS